MKMIFLPLALLPLAVTQSRAADEDEPRTSVVHFARLDLSQAGDLAKLRHRITRAIIRVCDDNGSNNLLTLRYSTECRRETAQRLRIEVAKLGPNRDARDVRRTQVQVSDLDLGRGRDRRALDQRLAQAVTHTCRAAGTASEGACRAELANQPGPHFIRLVEHRASPDAG